MTENTIKKISVEKVGTAKTPHNVDVRKLLSFEHATIVHILLKPGESLHPHITPVDALFYGLEGQGIVSVGQEEARLSQDEMVFSPKGIKHLLRNESSEDFRFLVIKVPTQKQKTTLL